jgi:transposase
MDIRYRFSDGEWAKVSVVLPKPKRRKDGRGRPPKNPRQVLEGILWILFSGAPWHMLPKEFPPYQTCHRYFQHWTQKGIFKKILKQLSLFHSRPLSLKDMHFIDGSFAAAKKGVMV